MELQPSLPKQDQSSGTQTSFQNINKQQNKIKYQKNQKYQLPIKVRNRRYRKLIELRKSGFFDEQTIKLRHPLLYYLYVGQHDFEDSISSSKQNESNPNLFSDFLQKNLLNIQYRNLLNEQLTEELEKKIQQQKNINEEQIQQMRKMFLQSRNSMKNSNKELLFEKNSQMDLQQSDLTSQNQNIYQMSKNMRNHQPTQSQIQNIRNFNRGLNNDPNKKRSSLNQINSFQDNKNNSLFDPQATSQLFEKINLNKKLNIQQLSLQQQHLIQHCQQLFLYGNLVNIQEIDYNQIDNNSQYDDQQQQNKDSQQKYFQNEGQQMQAGQENYYTGIQDY